MSDVTRILSAIEQGDPLASEQLLPLVYDELRKLAAAKLAQEKPCQTLQATALVHEAYVRLVDVNKAQEWDSRGHFFAARPRLCGAFWWIAHAQKGSAKRGGTLKRLNVDDVISPPRLPPTSCSRSTTLSPGWREDPPAAKIVELRYFAGLTVDEAGKVLGISTATAYRHWNYARAWLHGELLGTAEYEPGAALLIFSGGL